MGIAPLAPADPEQIAGYRLQGRLGAGGQGVVYQAHSDSGGLVAVKALHVGWLADPGARARLAKEVAAARRVAPFCTARVLEADLEAAQPFVVSEFIPGPSLAEHVRTAGPLEGTSLDRLAVGTMTALLAIHEAGLVHRDVKPANVILGPDGPRVVDFGIVRDLNGHATGTSSMIGTPVFMAPEQVSGQPLTPAADIFSWAAMMVFAATGASPFEAENVSAILYRVVSAPVDLAGVPARLGGVLEGCLVKEPSARPTAQQVLLQLIGSRSARVPAAVGQTLTYVDRDEGDTRALLARAATIINGPAPATLTGTALTGTAPAGTALTGTAPAGAAPGGTARRRRESDARPESAGRARRGLPSVLWAAPAVLALAGWGLFAARSFGWIGPSDRTPSPASAPLVVGSGPQIPKDFAGTWQGGLSADGNNWVVRLTLRRGSTLAEQTLAEQGREECPFVLTVTEVSADRLTLSFVAVPTKAQCGDPLAVTMTEPQPPKGSTLPPSTPFQVGTTSLRDGQDSAQGSVQKVG